MTFGILPTREARGALKPWSAAAHSADCGWEVLLLANRPGIPRHLHSRDLWLCFMHCDRFHSIQRQNREQLWECLPISPRILLLSVSKRSSRDCVWAAKLHLTSDITIFQKCQYLRKADVLNQSNRLPSFNGSVCNKWISLSSAFLLSLASFRSPFGMLRLYHCVTLSAINTAIMPLTSPGDCNTCLSALLNSRLVKVKSWLGSGGGSGERWPRHHVSSSEERLSFNAVEVT